MFVVKPCQVDCSVFVQMHSDWENKFGKHLGKQVVLLTGETSSDLPMLRTVCNPLGVIPMY